MFKKYLNDLRLSKLAYLLEIIEIRDFKSKIKAFNKINQMKLTKDMGLLILDKVDFESHSNSDFNITTFLLSLLFSSGRKIILGVEGISFVDRNFLLFSIFILLLN